MNIPAELVPITGILAGVIIVSITKFTQYRLRVEQIRADALVRAEQVKAKNQLEIEKLMLQDQERYQHKAKNVEHQGDVSDDPYARSIKDKRERC